jgi:hypothetical protein
MSGVCGKWDENSDQNDDVQDDGVVEEAVGVAAYELVAAVGLCSIGESVWWIACEQARNKRRQRLATTK